MTAPNPDAPATVAHYALNGMNGKALAYTYVEKPSMNQRIEVTDPNTRALMIAIAEQGEKLRRLLVILLVWVPLAMVAIWVIVTLILASAGSTSASTGTAPDNACLSAGDC